MDVDKQQGIARDLGVTAMPTFVLFKNGKERPDRILGANVRALENAIKQIAWIFKERDYSLIYGYGKFRKEDIDGSFSDQQNWGIGLNHIGMMEWTLMLWFSRATK